MSQVSSELLHRLRTLSQALADLVTKHKNMQQSHPERSALARMIRQLQTEIELRGG